MHKKLSVAVWPMLGLSHSVFAPNGNPYREVVDHNLAITLPNVPIEIIATKRTSRLPTCESKYRPCLSHRNSDTSGALHLQTVKSQTKNDLHRFNAVLTIP